MVTFFIILNGFIVSFKTKERNYFYHVKSCFAQNHRKNSNQSQCNKKERKNEKKKEIMKERKKETEKETYTINYLRRERFHFFSKSL